MSESVFNKLSAVPVNNKVRKKGNFWYVSWSNAVREMLKRYPESNWEFTQWESLPYLKTECGYFVECAVTIEGITRKQMMPVLDHKNQVVQAPDAAQINKAQMRALTKAIALHGFGLDLWAGEDLDGDIDDRDDESIDYISAISEILQEQGKTMEMFIEWAGKVLKREIKSIEDLSDGELKQFHEKLRNAK